MFRFLASGHDNHEDHSGHDHAAGAKDDLTGLKILILFLIVLSASFVFFPFIPKFKNMG